MAAGFRFHHPFVSNTHIFFSVAEKQISYQTTHDSTHRLLVLEKIGLMCGITCGESEGLKIKMARHCLMRVLPVSCLKLGACQRWVKTNIVEIWWNWIKLAHGFMLLVHHTCVEVLKNTIARCQRRTWLQYESEKKKTHGYMYSTNSKQDCCLSVSRRSKLLFLRLPSFSRNLQPSIKETIHRCSKQPCHAPTGSYYTFKWVVSDCKSFPVPCTLAPSQYTIEAPHGYIFCG